MVPQTAFYPESGCFFEPTLDSRTLCPLDCRRTKEQVRPAHGLARRGAASTSGIILKTIDLSRCDCPASRTCAFLCAPALVIGSQTTGGASLESGLRPPCTRHAACHPHSRPIRPLICIPPRVPAAGSSKARADASRTRQTCSKEVRVARGRGRPLGGGGEGWRGLLRVEWGGSSAGAPGTSGKPGLRAGRAVVRSCDPPDGRSVVHICMFSVHASLLMCVMNIVICIISCPWRDSGARARINYSLSEPDTACRTASGLGPDFGGSRPAL